MGAALGRDERMDLVHDDRLDRAEDLASLRGEQEVERLGRRDEDVGRRALHLRPLARWGVTRADGYLWDVQGAALCRDPRERRAEIALHVDGQGLEGRNVQNPATFLFCWSFREHQPVDGRQKGSKRLSGPGGRKQKGGFSRENRGP